MDDFEDDNQEQQQEPSDQQQQFAVTEMDENPQIAEPDERLQQTDEQQQEQIPPELLEGLPKFEAEQQQNESFYSNIIGDYDISDVRKVTQRLLDLVDDDLNSRSNWEESCVKALESVGLEVVDLDQQLLIGGCKVTDPIMLQCLYNFFANAKVSLFPSDGQLVRAVSIRESGEGDEQIGEALENLFNYYFENICPEYARENDRHMLYAGFFGSGFKKIFYNESKKRIESRNIAPQDLIADFDTTSLSDAGRITHRYFLTKEAVNERYKSGVFFREDFSASKVSASTGSKTDDITKKIESLVGFSSNQKGLVEVYEIHAYLSEEELKGESKYNIEDDINIEFKPYVITVLKNTNTPVALHRNWEEEDEQSSRLECFTQTNFLEGFGFYGTGIAQMLGSTATMLTGIERNCIDSANMKMFPGGVRRKGVKFGQNNIKPGIGEWLEVDTGASPLNDCFMPLPYAEVSQALLTLRDQIRNESLSFMGAIQANISEESNTNTPVGTILAVLEKTNLITSVVLQGLRQSFFSELKIWYRLFASHLSDSPFIFYRGRKEHFVNKNFFDGSYVMEPACDSKVTSYVQQVSKAESLLKLAQSAPEIHDMRAIYHHVYTILDVPNIDEILPKPKPPEAPEGPPPIDPNQILLEEAKVDQMKAQTQQLSAQSKHKLDYLKLMMQYNIEQQKLNVERVKAGLQLEQITPLPTLDEIPDLALPQMVQEQPQEQDSEQPQEEQQTNGGEQQPDNSPETNQNTPMNQPSGDINNGSPQ